MTGHTDQVRVVWNIIFYVNFINLFAVTAFFYADMSFFYYSYTLFRDPREHF